VRLGQDRSKGAASPARRGSAVGNRRPRRTRASGMGGFGVGEGDLVTGQSGPVGAYWGAVLRCGLRQASSVRWAAAAAPLRDRTGEGREERGRERRAGIQITFS
jgi:hypothetical protein